MQKGPKKSATLFLRCLLMSQGLTIPMKLENMNNPDSHEKKEIKKAIVLLQKLFEYCLGCVPTDLLRHPNIFNCAPLTYGICESLPSFWKQHQYNDSVGTSALVLNVQASTGSTT